MTSGSPPTEHRHPELDGESDLTGGLKPEVSLPVADELGPQHTGQIAGSDIQTDPPQPADLIPKLDAKPEFLVQDSLVPSEPVSSESNSDMAGIEQPQDVEMESTEDSSSGSDSESASGASYPPVEEAHAEAQQEQHSKNQDASRSPSEAGSRYQSPVNEPHSPEQKDPHDLEHENSQLQEELKESKAEVAQLEDLYQQWTEYHRRYKLERDQETNGLSQTIQEQQSIITTMKEEEIELRRALVFLTSEDRCSATDVTEQVRGLNYEILQVSTGIAERVSGNILWIKSEETLGDKHKIAFERAEKLFSPSFAQELPAFDWHKDPTLLQLALQALLCSYCRRFIESWDGERYGLVSQQLDLIYEAMKAKESQSVFARWRMMTTSYLNSLLKEGGERTFATVLGERVLDVLTIANVQYPNLSELLGSFLNDRLRTIESHAVRIRNSIRLEFVSGDLSVIYIHPGNPFNNTGMRETFDATGDIEGDQVACTTELGLRMTKKVTKGEEVREEQLLLLQPQVLRDSSLRELVQP